MKIIVTVHGIRTFGQWQHRLAILTKMARPDARFVHYSYGYFSSLAFCFPPFRRAAVRRFSTLLVRLRASEPLTTIDIVSHSFGTHLVGWALYDLAPRNLRFGTIILSGSVLKVGFPWQELIDRYVVARVINDCGLQDSVLVLSQLCACY